jgi:hypothetical protein
MTRYFVDTSALVKRYHAERGTDVVDVLFAEPHATLRRPRHRVVELRKELVFQEFEPPVRFDVLCQTTA